MSHDTQDPNEAKSQILNALSRCMGVLVWYDDTPEEVSEMLETVSAPSAYTAFSFDDQGITSEFCPDPTGAVPVHIHVNISMKGHFEVRICAPTIHQMPLHAVNAAIAVLREACETGCHIQLILEQSMPRCSETVAEQAMQSILEERSKMLERAGFTDSAPLN